MKIEIPEDKKEIAINYIRGVIEELDRAIEVLDRVIEENDKEAAENGKEQE